MSKDEDDAVLERLPPGWDDEFEQEFREEHRKQVPSIDKQESSKDRIAEAIVELEISGLGGSEALNALYNFLRDSSYQIPSYHIPGLIDAKLLQEDHSIPPEVRSFIVSPEKQDILLKKEKNIIKLLHFLSNDVGQNILPDP